MMIMPVTPSRTRIIGCHGDSGSGSRAESVRRSLILRLAASLSVPVFRVTESESWSKLESRRPAPADLRRPGRASPAQRLGTVPVTSTSPAEIMIMMP
eukprot:1333760-Rhodomonas_salina.1